MSERSRIDEEVQHLLESNPDLGKFHELLLEELGNSYFTIPNKMLEIYITNTRNFVVILRKFKIYFRWKKSENVMKKIYLDTMVNMYVKAEWKQPIRELLYAMYQIDKDVDSDSYINSIYQEFINTGDLHQLDKMDSSFDEIDARRKISEVDRRKLAIRLSLKLLRSMIIYYLIEKVIQMDEVENLDQTLLFLLDEIKNDDIYKNGLEMVLYRDRTPKRIIYILGDQSDRMLKPKKGRSSYLVSTFWEVYSHAMKELLGVESNGYTDLLIRNYEIVNNVKL